MIRRAARLSPCHRCGQSVCNTAVCLLLSGVVLGTPAFGQPVVSDPGRMPPPLGATTGVAIGSMFLLSPAQPPLTSSTALSERCFPGECFQGLLMIRANQRWQLQLRLDPGAPLDASVSWLPDSPVNPSLLLTNGWETIASGTAPTAGFALSLVFRVVPVETPVGAAVLTSAIQYRLIALP